MPLLWTFPEVPQKVFPDDAEANKADLRSVGRFRKDNQL